jgi:hypothetical protein
VPRYNSPSADPAFWILNDFFAGVFTSTNAIQKEETNGADKKVEVSSPNISSDRDVYYETAFAILRTLMKTISVTRVSSVESLTFIWDWQLSTTF